ncbi:MAG: glycosyltransferase [Bacteroidales bacterium]|nr:glycosyltransferase [Bacteroidales bacterium]
MKVLFVSSGNSKKFEIAPFIKAQGDSLIKQGIDLEYFRITEKGILGYIKNAVKLRKYLINNRYDIIHAHYTLSGWSVVLSFTKIPIILSLMGSDAYGSYIGPNKITLLSRFQIVLTYLIQPFINNFICKSNHIESFVLNKKKSYVIPNGIILENIKYCERGYRKELGLELSKKYVLFLGSKTNIRKNYSLANEAIKEIAYRNVELIAPYPISHEAVTKYLNSVDLIVVSSFMEGSPNVVKEAMACNLPIVASKVGDIEWLLEDLDGCYVADFKGSDFSNKIKQALKYAEEKGRTKGRKRIMSLGLSSEMVADKIIHVYKRILEK